MIFMHAYVCLFICLWFMTSSKGKICWNYTVWRKGKWLEGILVLKGIYVYKGTCPPTALSFFLSSSHNVLYFIQYNYVSLYLCSPVFSSSAQPSRLPCPCPRLAKPSHLRPHRAKSALVAPLSESREVASSTTPCPSTASPPRLHPSPLPSSRPHPPRVPWIPFPFLAHPLHPVYISSVIWPSCWYSCASGGGRGSSGPLPRYIRARYRDVILSLWYRHDSGAIGEHRP
jgi:hypothetical protein